MTKRAATGAALCSIACGSGSVHAQILKNLGAEPPEAQAEQGAQTGIGSPGTTGTSPGTSPGTANTNTDTAPLGMYPTPTITAIQQPLVLAPPAGTPGVTGSTGTVPGAGSTDLSGDAAGVAGPFAVTPVPGTQQPGVMAPQTTSPFAITGEAPPSPAPSPGIGGGFAAPPGTVSSSDVSGVGGTAGSPGTAGTSGTGAGTAVGGTAGTGSGTGVGSAGSAGTASPGGAPESGGSVGVGGSSGTAGSAGTGGTGAAGTAGP